MWMTDMRGCDMTPTRIILDVFVPGNPVTQGSKRLGRNRATGAAILIEDRHAELKNWRAAVSWYAMKYKTVARPVTGPIRLLLTFYLKRPKSHYRTGQFVGMLKDNAPTYCGRKPDWDKIARAVCDALTGIIYVDDGQVADPHAPKLYANGAPGVHIVAETIEEKP